VQVIDPHTHQYLDRMKDEPIFLALAQKASDYLTRQNDDKGLSRIALRRVEHFYYKSQPVYEAMRKLATAQQQEAQEVVQVGWHEPMFLASIIILLIFWSSAGRFVLYW
jgi:translation initiation factor 3 subunit C